MRFPECLRESLADPWRLVELILFLVYFKDFVWGEKICGGLTVTIFRQ